MREVDEIFIPLSVVPSMLLTSSENSQGGMLTEVLRGDPLISSGFATS
jgi:hypothetical protein